MLKQKKGYSNLLEIEQKFNQQKPDYLTLKPFDSSYHSRNEKVIKFVGDVKTNIEQTLSNIKCTKEIRQQFRQILLIYANKIVKLREERNLYREMLHYKDQKQSQEIIKLQQKIKEMSNTSQISNNNRKSCLKCTCFDQNDDISDQYSQHTKNSSKVKGIPRESLKSFLNDITSQRSNLTNREYKNDFGRLFENKNQEASEEMLGDDIQGSDIHKEIDSLMISRSENQSQVSETAITQEELMKLMFKYNISVEQLENIFEEYQKEHKKAFELYDEEKQQKLYRLGQKMQKDLNNKKVLKDLKNISEIKSKILKK